VLCTEAEELAGGYSADCEIITLQGKESEEILKFIQEGAVELNGYGGLGHIVCVNYSWAASQVPFADMKSVVRPGIIQQTIMP